MLAVGAAAATGLAGAEATEPVVDDALTVVFQDGDHVVFGTAADEHAPADAKAGETGFGAVRHDGFSTYGDSRLSGAYEVRLVASDGVERLRPYVAEAVAAASAAGGISLALRPGTIDRAGPARGQIDVMVSEMSPCGGMWLGCGGPNIDQGTITSGQIWINPRAFDRPPSELSNTVRHELGHTLGLGHYEYLHEDRVQTMHPTRFDAATYESGDRDGLRFVAGKPPIDPAAEPPPAPTDPVGAIEAALAGPFGITVRGWAVDPETASPVTVVVTVDGVPTVVVADEERISVDGRRRPAGYETARPAGAGIHEVCATVRNVGRGSDTPLGCIAVVVSASSVGQLGLQTF